MVNGLQKKNIQTHIITYEKHTKQMDGNDRLLKRVQSTSAQPQTNTGRVFQVPRSKSHDQDQEEVEEVEEEEEANTC